MGTLLFLVLLALGLLGLVLAVVPLTRPLGRRLCTVGLLGALALLAAYLLLGVVALALP